MNDSTPPWVTVAIPVGPSPRACEYLEVAVESVIAQTYHANILLFGDMHAYIRNRYDQEPVEPLCETVEALALKHRQFFRDSVYCANSEWKLGVAHAFNAAVAHSPTDLVFMLGADDTMEPTCIERSLETWEKNGRHDAYYYAGIRYMDTGEEQTEPCGEAMVTKGLWRLTGGFPVESAVGAPDCALISVMMVHMPDRLIPIADGAPLVNYRRHADTDTATRPVSWQGPIMVARDILTSTWKQPEWGRFS